MKWLRGTQHERIVDIGANDGKFSKMGVTQCNVIATDIDPNAINDLYKSGANVTPLVLNFTNPTAPIGWANTERKSFIERLGGDNSIIALALTHHLRITYGIPFDKQFSLFSCIGKNLLI